MSDSLRGKFLVASKELRDRNFYRAVVLMVEHNADGAMGLVVNRPTATTVTRALAKHFELPDNGNVIHYGGPVEPAALFILHNSGDFDPEEKAIVPDLYVGSSENVFRAIIESLTAGSEQAGGDLRFRVFAGCAGWGANQLESELARGDWHLTPAASEFVLSDDPYSLWSVLMRRIGDDHLVLPRADNDPEWN